jgi:hypothetical protein
VFFHIFYRIFGLVSLHVDERALKFFPLILLLGFFVKIVVDRWKDVFQNIGFIDE